MCMCALGGQPILGVILRNTVHFFATKPLPEVDVTRLDSLRVSGFLLSAYPVDQRSHPQT